MSFDLHRALVRKQERECSRADDFAFRARARSFGRFGEWLRGEGISVDAAALAERIVTESDAAIFAQLLAAHGGDAFFWRRAFTRAQTQAEAELRAEIGNPEPARLA